MPQDPKPIKPIGRLPGDTGPAKGTEPGRLPGDVHVTHPEEGLSGKQQSFSYDDYKFQPKLNQDNDLLRAQNQSGWEQAGRFLGNLVPNIAGSLVENVGYLGALGSEWGNDRDYSNFLTDLGQSMHNSLFGDIYREHPNQVWDAGDPAWWYTNAESLVESATAFAGEGAAIGKLFSTLGKATRLARLGKLGAQAENALAHVGTAATLAYTEAAQFGGTTYDTVYKEQYQKLRRQGASPTEADDHAKHMASQGAAAAVQLNTIMATGLNALELTPFFHGDADILGTFKKVGKREVGESFPTYEARIRSLNSADATVNKMLNLRKQALYSYLGSTVTEGTEELVNQWAEQRGLERGRQNRELKGLSDLLGDADSFFSDTMNSAGALSFVLGGFGGVAQNVLLDNIPIHQVYKTEDGQDTLRKFDAKVTEDGKYQTKLVSGRYRNEVGNRAFFDNIKDAVVTDIAHINEISAKLAQATEKGQKLEADKYRFRMFDTAAMNSIQLGLGDMFESQYEDIGKLDNHKSLHEQLIPKLKELSEAIDQTEDPEQRKALLAERNKVQAQADALTGVTEAMQKGFAKTPQDNEYKKKSTQAINDLKEYQKLWEDISGKYRNGDEWDSRYADYLFSKDVDLRRKSKLIKQAETNVAQTEMLRDSQLDVAHDPLALKTISEAISDNNVRQELSLDIDDINKAKNLLLAEKTKEQGALLLKEVATKYLPNTDSIEDLPGAMPKMLAKIQERLKELDVRVNNNVQATEESPEYSAWKAKHPKGTVLEYIKLQAERNALDEEITADKSEIKIWKEQTQVSQSFLKELRTAKGKADYIKKAKATMNKIAKELNGKINKDNKAFADNLFDEKSVDELNQIQKDEYAQSLQAEIKTLTTDLSDLQTGYNETAAARSELLGNGLISRLKNRKSISANKDQLLATRNRIDQISDRIAYLNAQLAKLNLAPDVVAVLPQPSNAALNALKDVSDANVDAVMQNFFDDSALYRSILTNVLNLQPASKQELIAKAHQIINSSLSRVGRPALGMDTNIQIAFWTLADRWLEKYLTQAQLIKTSDQIHDLNTNEVILAVRAATSSAKRQADILAFLDEYEQALTSGREVFSLNALADAGFTGKGRISQAKGANIMQAFATQHEDLVKQKEEAVPIPPAKTIDEATNEGLSDVVNEGVTEGEEPPIPPVTLDDLPVEDPSDSTIGQPLPTELDEYVSLVLDAVAHEGAKVIDASAKINTLTHDYEQDIHQNEDGLYYTNRDVYLLNDAVNPLYLQPGYLKKGHEVRMVIDKDWLGTVNETTKFTYGMPIQKSDKFNDYIDPRTGGIIMNAEKYGNMPVKIVDVKSGTILGYLPRMDWIRAQYPNKTNDYRNVVDTKTDSEGNVVFKDNVARQAEANRLLREKLATAYNMGKQEGLDSKITSRDTGIVLRSTPGRMRDLLPDTTLQFALFGSTEARTGPQSPVQNLSVSPWMEKNKIQNVPGILLPAPNGQMVFEPIWTDKVSKADIDTVIRAIEIYLSVDGDTKVSEAAANTARAEAEYIQQATGFNILDTQGLKNFINQYYTYTQGFNDAQIKANQEVLKGQKRQPVFMLAIADTSGEGFSKSIVKAGVSYLNRLAKAKVNAQGKINNDFRKLLEDQGIGLASRNKNVIFSRPGLRGINSAGKMSEVIYQPATGGFRTESHGSYNEMIKAYAQTSVYGKLTLNTKINPQVKKDTYVYFANPVTQMDYKGTMAQDIRVTRKGKKIPTDMDTVIEPETKPEVNKITEAEREYLRNLPDPFGDPSGPDLFKLSANTKTTAADKQLGKIIESTITTEESEAIAKEEGIPASQVQEKVAQAVKNVIDNNSFLQKLGKTLQSVVNRIMKVLLTTGLLVSLWNTTNSFTAYTPTTTGTKTEATYRDSSYNRLTQDGKDAYLSEVQNNQAFIIIDKPTATGYVYDSTGKLIKDFPVLLGKSIGDAVNTADVNDATPSNAFTTAGRFSLSMGASPSLAAEFEGRILSLKNSNNLAIHETYPGEIEKRTAALNTPGAEDNRQSWGCINVSQSNFDKYIKNTVGEDSKIIITRDVQQVKKEPIGESNYKPTIIYESAGATSGPEATIDSLTNLLNFTPVENRNGKVPSEILEEMTRQGLTTLPSGFNPFYTCN